MKTFSSIFLASLFLLTSVAPAAEASPSLILRQLPILPPVFTPAPLQCNSYETPTLIVLRESSVDAPASQQDFAFLAVSACVSHVLTQACTGSSGTNPACYNQSSLLAGSAYVGVAAWTSDGRLRPVPGSLQTRPFIGTFYESKLPAHGDNVSLRNADGSIHAEGNFAYSYLDISGPGSVTFTVDQTTMPYAEVTQWQ